MRREDKWYTKLWMKFVLEIVVTGLLWFAFTIFRRWLPKRYRIRDKTVRDLILDFSSIFTNMAKKSDSVTEVIGKSRTIFEHFYEKYHVADDEYDEFKLYIADLEEELDVIKNETFTLLIYPKLENKVVTPVFNINNYQQVVKVTFPCCKQHLYMLRRKQSGTEDYGYEKFFACPKGFNPMSLVNELFQIYDNKLYVSCIRGGEITYAKLDHACDNYILDKKHYKSLMDEIKAFKDKGIQRSYIIHGPPGTGKTSFCIELALASSDKVVKLDSTVFTNLTSRSARILLENLDCNFIVVDDIDRINTSDRATFLYALETLKSYPKLPTLLATCNDIDKLDKAMIRPGRFDDIIMFGMPKAPERRNFLETMLKKLNVSITDEELTLFVKETDGMSQAYLKEYCNQLRIEASVETVLKKIKDRKRYLGNFVPEDETRLNQSLQSISLNAQQVNDGDDDE